MKPKDRFPLVIAVGVMLLASLACVIPGIRPVATLTPTFVPTEMATATATPVPPTSTPTPTATPDRAATQSFRATQTFEAQSGEVVEILQKIEYPTDTGSLAWVQKDDANIELVEYNTFNYIPFGNEQEYSNFILKSEVTWEAEGIMVCGFMMRSEDDFEKGEQYKFLFLRFSGLPAWDIEFYDNGQFKTNITGQIKFSSALDLNNGATNQFIIIAEDDKFTIYINGERQGSYYDWSKLASKGQFAFFASHESGPASCEFKNSWIWALK